MLPPLHDLLYVQLLDANAIAYGTGLSTKADPEEDAVDIKEEVVKPEGRFSHADWKYKVHATGTPDND